MINFTYYNPAKIIFGKDEECNVGSYVSNYSKRILLHFGGGTVKKIGLYDKILASLKNSGIFFVELGGVKPNPRLSLVHEGIKLCRENKLDFILAVGGGSVIDSAKAISIGKDYEGDVWDFYDRKLSPSSALPIGVVLTIPAAGSESSDSSVVTNDEIDDVQNWEKRHTAGDCIIPKFAILNPEITTHLPDYQTSCGSADIIAHLIERYFTTVDNVDFTDRLIEAALKTMINNVPKALRSPKDYNARAEIMWTSTIAHNNLLNTGRIGDWASHNMEHELSAIYDIAHGAGLSIIMPAWMEYICCDPLYINKFIQFAIRVFDVDYSFDNMESIAVEGVYRLKEFFKSIGLPTSFKDIGKDEKDFDIMAKKAVKYGSIGNFKKIEYSDIINIYKLAL